MGGTKYLMTMFIIPSTCASIQMFCMQCIQKGEEEDQLTNH